MKTIPIVYLFAIIVITCTNYIYAQSDLNGVTFGFSAGYSIINHKPNDYYLSPDSNTLQVQPLSKGSFVISSVISVKLGKLAVGTVTTSTGKSIRTLVTQDNSTTKAPWYTRFSINAALDLLNVKSDNVSFNTKVNGGLGIGYFLTDNVQIATFYDIQTIRQMHDYIVTKYNNKQIPTGTDFYNALDQTDNKFFYNKTFTGWSFKVIFSLANKKPADF